MVGVIGGGQLARMCQPPAVALGVQLSVLVEDGQASAALVVPSAPVGGHDDLAAVREFARRCDVVTFDHEQVPTGVLAALEADGVDLQPSPRALVFAQDKLLMRRRLTDLGVPCPRWAQVVSAEEVAAFGAEVGWPLVVKAPRGGYDGKGVLVASCAADVEPWLAAVARDRAAVESSSTEGVGSPRPAFADGLLVEEKVDFVRELAVSVARSPSGQASAWPVVETVQVDGVCAEVLAPAPGLSEEIAGAATRDALRIAGELGVTGVLAVEMFELAAGPGEDRPRFVVNELAMRPHNSGHWTIEGAVTSQFEQHLRAVLDLPLGDPRPRARWTVMGNVLGGDYPELYSTYRHLLARDPGLRVHFYGKEVRPGRKIGHVTVCGDDLADLRDRARHATEFVSGVVTE
ncbi:5-(carboxyamino)imidazole ribonucleotide synthase [Austwickia chelonae]|uniref:N5-carboxyaminoimidazole ribonucleotide synthase n=1 Tax=Austwickia chelonae NBRC 105200 TaxID=1184607 RepID=K6VN07_9MICO|nr:phosphoribosylaminoimidazole carboxylase ATPase subunit [Austwickia chelonae NBRC 105200]SEW30301.1 5-(carboxyamino)imidazole ribonucleotide synthase [Austwickia chelonae]